MCAILFLKSETKRVYSTVLGIGYSCRGKDIDVRTDVQDLFYAVSKNTLNTPAKNVKQEAAACVKYVFEINDRPTSAEKQYVESLLVAHHSPIKGSAMWTAPIRFMLYTLTT